MFNKDVLKSFSSVKTPFYYYDLLLLDQTLQSLVKPANQFGYHVHYALKANTNTEILKLISKAGLGADCVSGNEILKAKETGFSSGKIVFAGVGKSDEEIEIALNNSIYCFNIESFQELEVINQIAARLNKTANIAIRINPNVDAHTHHYITTGLEENKFGINEWELNEATEKIRSLTRLKLIGLHFHIGSQISDLDVFKNLCNRVNHFQKFFANKKIVPEHINVGGGLGINYHEPDKQSIVDFDSYFKVFHQFLAPLPGQQIHFELGRAIVAQCSSLITRVLYIKNGVKTNFAIVDAGLTELIRPALYQSYHKIENLTKEFSEEPNSILKYDVVGPICESSDCFGKAVLLPETLRGDLIAIRSTGAYGEVMSSGYNLRDKALVVYRR